MSALQPHELRDSSRFRLLDTLDHRTLVPTLNAYLRRITLVVTSYIATNLLVFALLIWLVRDSSLPVLDALSQVALGFVVSYFLLVPIHEGVHALTYRFYGASQVRVVYHWRTLHAYCAADQFVVNSRQFAWICIMPFLVVNALLVALVAIGGLYQLLAAGALLLHVGACSGDVALLNYLWAHRGTDVFTYDDMVVQRSYFYRSV